MIFMLHDVALRSESDTERDDGIASRYGRDQGQETEPESDASGLGQESRSVLQSYDLAIDVTDPISVRRIQLLGEIMEAVVGGSRLVRRRWFIRGVRHVRGQLRSCSTSGWREWSPLLSETSRIPQAVWKGVKRREGSVAGTKLDELSHSRQPFHASVDEFFFPPMDGPGPLLACEEDETKRKRVNGEALGGWERVTGVGAGFGSLDMSRGYFFNSLRLFGGIFCRNSF